uniref:Uncharacterized protein LOC104225535 n=1 Tax=Nicotiana sylvestris TaxID=4096 RepID=A0A1U7WN19_NICSY|nr:PREDICTED: uncharacterized protein LOC104225535 [Nicotiana sylvestris]
MAPMYQQLSNPPSYLSHGSSSSNNEMGRIENMFKQMTEKNAESDAQLASHNTLIHNVKVQMGKNSQALNSRPKGALPSDMIVNPKGGNNTEHAMAIITKSGRDMNAPTSNEKRLVDDDQVVQEEEIPNNVVQANEEARAPLMKPPPPHPQRLSNQNGENQFKKFKQMMKSLSINVPLVEALEQMPSYAKFTKDLVSKKRSMNFETIKVTHQYQFGALFALQNFGNWATRPTFMRFQMTDHTIEMLLGVIEDVLIRVDKFILLVDFVIQDCEVDYEVPIILGRTFLATGKALCDVEAGELTFRVGDEKLVFHVFKPMWKPNSNEVCCFLDLVTNVIVDDTSATTNVGDMLEVVLLNFNDNEMDWFMECANSLQGMDLDNRKTPLTKTSIGEPPTLELKPLPRHLWYEFLDLVLLYRLFFPLV